MQTYGNRINNQQVMPTDDRWLQTSSPYTGEVWARVPDSPAAVDTAVAAARKAFDEGRWPRMSGVERAAIMRKLGALLTENAETLGQIESRDNGKIIRETGAQAKALQSYYDFFAGVADKIGGDVLPSPNPNFLIYTEKVPIGVVGAIVPWNSPLMLLTWKLAPLLASGCTVVVKPSDITPVTALLLADIAAEAGLPEGVLNVVTGGAEVGAKLSGHTDLDKITFTGGGSTARHVATAAAQNLIPAILELGGKSPQVVFDDADVEAAVNGLLAGIFAAGGQTCVAGSRAYVHAAIYDEVVARLVKRANEIVMGNPADMATEMGPVASDAQRERILGMIEKAIAEGAVVEAGGCLDPDLGGRFIRPTILSNVNNQTSIVREEVFGPVLAIMKFSSTDDISVLANDSEFGLAAGIWTKDIQRAHGLAKQLRVGTVWINAYRAVSYAVPFGGFKQSGYGRDNGLEAMDAFLETRTTWVELSGATRDPFVLG